jgi:pteridine reductase
LSVYTNMTKTALITGAAKRVGKAMAHHLASNGWNIAIHYNSSASAAEMLRNELKLAFPLQQFELLRADLNDANQVEELINDAFISMKTVDLLINNASVFDRGNFAGTATGFLDRQMNVNFRAPFILTREFARLAKKGLIINFVDTRITNNKSNFAAYSLSKKALWEMTKMAALEFGPDIRINAIAPGLTLAPEEKNDDYLKKLAEHIAMKRPGGLIPILQSLDYIVNNDYLTGQLLFCDGGENLGLTN